MDFCDSFQKLKENPSWIHVIPKLLFAVDPSTNTISLKDVDIEGTDEV